MWLLSVPVLSGAHSLLLMESRNFSQPHSQDAKRLRENELLSTN